MYPMEALHSFQVDEPEDLVLMEKLLTVSRRMNVSALSRVRLLALDFDGVMTDNRVVVDEKGYEAVVCHRGDGWGLTQLKRSGVDVIVISTEKNSTVAARCRKLGISHKQGCDDKLATLERVAADRGIKREEIAYVGNDVNDLACLNWVALPIAVGDASEEVKSAASWITRKAGGMGAVREVCDLILEQARVRRGISDI